MSRTAFAVEQRRLDNGISSRQAGIRAEIHFPGSKTIGAGNEEAEKYFQRKARAQAAGIETVRVEEAHFIMGKVKLHAVVP